MSLKELYGGALEALIPLNYFDVSTVRDVPDNQEVFTHQNTDQSIVIDIMEYVHCEDDLQACRDHFEALAQANSCPSDKCTLKSISPLTSHTFKECSSVYVLRGSQLVSKFKESAENEVNIDMAVFRLPSYDSDIVVCFNSPSVISPESSSSTRTSQTSGDDWTRENFTQMLNSLRMKDSSLIFATPDSHR